MVIHQWRVARSGGKILLTDKEYAIGCEGSAGVVVYGRLEEPDLHHHISPLFLRTLSRFMDIEVVEEAPMFISDLSLARDI